MWFLSNKIRKLYGCHQNQKAVQEDYMSEQLENPCLSIKIYLRPHETKPTRPQTSFQRKPMLITFSPRNKKEFTRVLNVSITAR